MCAFRSLKPAQKSSKPNPKKTRQKVAGPPSHVSSAPPSRPATPPSAAGPSQAVQLQFPLPCSVNASGTTEGLGLSPVPRHEPLELSVSGSSALGHLDSAVHAHGGLEDLSLRLMDLPPEPVSALGHADGSLEDSDGDRGATGRTPSFGVGVGLTPDQTGARGEEVRAFVRAHNRLPAEGAADAGERALAAWLRDALLSGAGLGLAFGSPIGLDRDPTRAHAQGAATPGASQTPSTGAGAAGAQAAAPSVAAPGRGEPTAAADAGGDSSSLDLQSLAARLGNGEFKRHLSKVLACIYNNLCCAGMVLVMVLVSLFHLLIPCALLSISFPNNVPAALESSSMEVPRGGPTQPSALLPNPVQARLDKAASIPSLSPAALFDPSQPLSPIPGPGPLLTPSVTSGSAASAPSLPREPAPSPSPPAQVLPWPSGPRHPGPSSPELVAAHPPPPPPPSRTQLPSAAAACPARTASDQSATLSALAPPESPAASAAVLSEAPTPPSPEHCAICKAATALETWGGRWIRRLRIVRSALFPSPIAVLGFAAGMLTGAVLFAGCVKLVDAATGSGAAAPLHLEGPRGSAGGEPSDLSLGEPSHAHAQPTFATLLPLPSAAAEGIAQLRLTTCSFEVELDSVGASSSSSGGGGGGGGREDSESLRPYPLFRVRTF